MNKGTNLKTQFPIIDKNENLPLGYQYSQLYSIFELDDKGDVIPLKEKQKLSIKKYKIPSIELYPAFYKPISKSFPV